MRYREFLPSQRLRPFIHYYWVFEKEVNDNQFSIDRFMPETEAYIVFQLAGSYRIRESGMETGETAAFAWGSARKPILADIPGNALTAGIRFRSGGAQAFRLFSPAEAGRLEPFETDWSARVHETLFKANKGNGFGEIGETLENEMLRLADRITIPENHRKVLALMRDSFSQSSYENVITRAGITERQAERISRQYTGYSPSEYRALVRCEYARDALFYAGEGDISSLAFALGFYDLPHFCRTFKKWTETTPVEYAQYCEPFRLTMHGEDSMRHKSIHYRRLSSALKPANCGLI